MRTACFILLLSTTLYGTTVLDRVAVVAGKHVIKQSDIDRDLRVTAFLNNAPLRFTPEAKRQSAERLIDQEIIRQEITTGNYNRPSEADAVALERQIIRDRFGGSEERFRRALADYGLTEQELRQQLLWQLSVLSFIDQRFRAGVLVTDDDVRKYYEQHLAELRRQYPGNSSFEALAPKIRDALAGELANKSFEEWLQEARKNYRIEYRQGAFE